MQRGRELTVPHLQKHFCEAGNAGRGFAMSDIRLDRSDGALLRRGGLVSLAQAGYLDGISQRRAGAVRFDVADGRCVNASLRKRASDYRGLRIGIGHGIAVGLAAVIQRRGLDDTVYSITVAERLRERLEENAAGAFARDVAVSVGAEALASAARGEELALAENDVLVAMKRQVDAAGQRKLAFARVQALAGEMHGGQR